MSLKDEESITSKLRRQAMKHEDPKVQECDASKDAQSTHADNKNKHIKWI